jgi:uncharacterized protein (TIGR02001 family)
MNKKVASLAIGALTAFGSTGFAQFDLSDLSMSTTFGFESEYVFRGKQVSDESFQGSVETSISGFYAGVWTSQPIADITNPAHAQTTGNEVDLYTGYTFGFYEGFTADVGVTYYWYPDSLPGPFSVDRSREVKFGLIYDHILSPSVYFYYDFDLEQTTLEFSAGYEYDTSEWISSTTLAFSGNLGFVDADDRFAGQTTVPAALKGLENNGYTYYGLTADLSYSFTETANASIGVRYTGNNDEDAISNFAGFKREGNFWWGISFSAGF